MIKQVLSSSNFAQHFLEIHFYQELHTLLHKSESERG